MNKKGMVFATFTVMIVFLFIISNIIYKMHAENKIKIKDVGLGTVDLLRQRGNFEFDNLISEKEIELKVNDALVRFANGEGREYLKDNRFNDRFYQYLKKDSNFLDYNFNLIEGDIEFELSGDADFIENTGAFSGDSKYEYKIELNKRDFITPDGIKSINI